MFANLGASLKGMLYEDTNDAAPAPTQQVKASQAGAMNVTGQVYAATPTVNQAMVDAIKKVTYSRNTAFTQLIAASETLSDVIPDPTMRLKAAFKTTGAGRTGRQVAEAVDVHLSDVAGEVRKFDQMIDNKMTIEVGQIEGQATQAQRQLESASSEIQSLSQRIQQLQSSLPELQTAVSQAQLQVSQARNELEGAKHEFKMAADVVTAELNNSKSAIVSTLV